MLSALTAADSMQAWQAAVLGLVEGLTEYLPVSSTGHLILAQRLIGIPESPAADAYAIVIQGGAIAAVLGLYRARAAQVLRGLGGRDAAGLRLLVQLCVAFAPAAVLGLLAKDWIHARLFGLQPVAWAWIAGGLGLLALCRWRRARGQSGRALESLGLAGALAIGCMQCLALCPGVSRSLATIAGGLLIGLSSLAAVEFSFLLGALTLLAASAHEAWSEREVLLAAYGPLELALGFLLAWLAAWLSVRWLVGWLARADLAIFGWYRLALGCAVLLALRFG